MKIVITSGGNTPQSLFDKRFGRASWFCFYDDRTGRVEFMENKWLHDNGGVGTRVAEMMIDMGVKKVISGDFGPKARALLEKFDVQMVVVQDIVPVDHILNQLKENAKRN